jgi:hypothetical protein
MRHSLELPALCTVISSEPAEKCSSIVHDISTTGIRFFVPSPLERNALVVIELPVLGKFAKRLFLARVRHAKKESGAGWTIRCEFIGNMKKHELRAVLNWRFLDWQCAPQLACEEPC